MILYWASMVSSLLAALGCGYLIAFIVTRNRFRNEMIKRGVARYDEQTGKWEWGEPPGKIQINRLDSLGRHSY